MKKLSRFLAISLLVAGASFIPTQSAQAFFGWMMPWNWFDSWGWDDYYYPYYGYGGPWGYHHPYYGSPWGGYPYGGYPVWGAPWGYGYPYAAAPVVVQQPAVATSAPK